MSYFKDDGIFVRPTYSGLLEGRPTAEISKNEIEELKTIAKSFCWLEPHVHLGDIDIETTPLPRRSYIAWITSDVLVEDENACGSHACIIWFDKDSEDLKSSMMNLLTQLDWASVAKDFDY